MFAQLQLVWSKRRFHILRRNRSFWITLVKVLLMVEVLLSSNIDCWQWKRRQSVLAKAWKEIYEQQSAKKLYDTEFTWAWLGYLIHIFSILLQIRRWRTFDWQISVWKLKAMSGIVTCDQSTDLSIVNGRMPAKC